MYSRIIYCLENPVENAYEEERYGVKKVYIILNHLTDQKQNEKAPYTTIESHVYWIKFKNRNSFV